MPSSQGSFVNTETLLALNLFSSLNHALSVSHPGTTWTWLATTLNPHYEGNDLGYMINDDRYLSSDESIQKSQETKKLFVSFLQVHHGEP